MGFICDVTGKHITSKPRRVISEIRIKEYDKRLGIVRQKDKVLKCCIDWGGAGWEIAKELWVNPELPEHQIQKLEDPRLRKIDMELRDLRREHEERRRRERAEEDKQKRKRRVRDWDDDDDE